jgi:hypothetical protein
MSKRTDYLNGANSGTDWLFDELTGTKARNKRAHAKIEELEATLQTIAKRDGRASDHMSCHDCGDSSNEAIAALKGEKG